jgi:chlorophyll(ide) b reductase
VDARELEKLATKLELGLVIFSLRQFFAHFLTFCPHPHPRVSVNLGKQTKKDRSSMKSLTSVAALFSLLWFLSLSHAFTTTTNRFAGTGMSALTRVRSSNTLSMSMADGGVVITGAAGGVGFAYAGEFMDRGYDVVICDVKDCSTAAKALTARHPNGKVFHTNCDVSDAKSVDKLGQFAKDNLGTVGYWINNAGVNGGRRALRDVPVSQVEQVVKVNLLGTLLGTKVAMDIMAEQVRREVDTTCSSLW